MNDMEELWAKEKEKLQQIQVPEEMESRLRAALANSSQKPTPFYRRPGLGIAILIVFALLIGTNYNAIASYGKQLFGYEEVMSGPLRELNNQGKGQLIGKSHTFENGISLTVDYVMLDENQLLLFYTVKDPAGKADKAFSPFIYLRGFMGGSHFQGSQGIISEDGTEVKYIAEFEPPPFWVRKVNLEFTLREQGMDQPAQITFYLDREKAMGPTLKKNLNAAIKVDETNVKVESITASPTRTVIKGSLQSIVNLALDKISGERFYPREINFRLLANGQEVEWQGGGLTTDMSGITFETYFDPLPTPLEDLKLELVSFNADHDVNQQYPLYKGKENQRIEILGQEVEINQIRENNGETFITITSEESAVLSKVYLLVDGERVSLEETTSDDYLKTEEGKILHKRTLRFKDAGEELQLDVKRFIYKKEYNEVIDIPLD